MKRARILLADDHRMVTEGLKGLLADEFELVGVVDDGRAMVAETKKLRPDVVVADISMPHLNGIDALAVLKKDNPAIKVVFLTMHQNAAYARRALEAGASGYVLKHSASTELVLAIHAALRGATFVTPALTAEVLHEAHHRPRDTNDVLKALTLRQREILQLLAEGHSAKQIGRMLAISPRTVEFHKYQMMDAHGLSQQCRAGSFRDKARDRDYLNSVELRQVRTREAVFSTSSDASCSGKVIPER